MIGKIVKGTSFSGCVNYVLKEDKSRLLKAVGVYGSPEEIAEQFKLQTLLNDKVKNTVGHISLSFSAEDGDRVRDDDGLMLKSGSNRTDGRPYPACRRRKIIQCGGVMK